MWEGKLQKLRKDKFELIYLMNFFVQLLKKPINVKKNKRKILNKLIFLSFFRFVLCHSEFSIEFMEENFNIGTDFLDIVFNFVMFEWIFGQKPVDLFIESYTNFDQ